MEEPTKSIKAMLCQTRPQLKKKIENIQRVQVSLKNYSIDDKIDIVMFPEMSFVGYNFENQADAEPYAVEEGKGEQF